MSRLVDQARVFSIIAPHLSYEERKRIAGKLAEQMFPARQPVTPNRHGAPPMHLTPEGSKPELFISKPRPEYEAADADPIVRFLRSLGYSDGELTRAAGRLASAVRADGAVAPITERYLALVWNRITEEAKPDAV